MAWAKVLWRSDDGQVYNVRDGTRNAIAGSVRPLRCVVRLCGTHSRWRSHLVWPPCNVSKANHAFLLTNTSYDIHCSTERVHMSLLHPVPCMCPIKRLAESSWLGYRSSSASRVLFPATRTRRQTAQNVFYTPDTPSKRSHLLPCKLQISTRPFM